jgi:uncharacterized lipoprotein YmbA
MRYLAIPRLALALALAGCASADPTYYTLQPAPGTPHPGPRLSIEIRRPGLAGYLDRSDVVLKSADYKLAVNSQIRWAEPLGDMIGRILAQDLSQRLPDSSVFTESGAISADPSLRLEVDILNFDTDAAGAVVLNAQIAVERGTTHTPLATRHVSLTAQPGGAGAAELAASLSGLLGQLADQVAEDIGSQAKQAVLFREKGPKSFCQFESAPAYTRFDG